MANREPSSSSSPEHLRTTPQQGVSTEVRAEVSPESGKKIGRIRDIVRRLIIPSLFLATGSQSDRPVTPPTPSSYESANGIDVGLPEGIHSFTPSFDAARQAFTKLYSTKAGKIFFINAKGELEREVALPPRLIFLQGSRDPKDREAFQAEFPLFMAGLEKEASKGSIHMASGEKFRQVLDNAKTRMKPVRNLLEQAFKHKTKKELANDKEHLWDVLEAGDRAKLLDLCMGIFGIESSFDPATKGGLAQFTAPILASLEMTEKDVGNVEKSVLGMAKLFEGYYRVLTQKNGATDVISRYGLKDGNFLIYALVDSYHRGGSNVLALCRSLLEDYPDSAHLPPEVRANSEELYTFMTHRGKKGIGTYGTYSAIYVPQVSAMADMLKAKMAPNTLLITKNKKPKKSAKTAVASKGQSIAGVSKVAPKWNNR